MEQNQNRTRMQTPTSTSSQNSQNGLPQVDGDEESMRTAVEMEDEEMISLMNAEIASDSFLMPRNSAQDLLEYRLLTAMASLRSAIERIKAAKQSPRDDTNHNLIVAICSLESAIDSMEVAEIATKKHLSEAGERLTTNESDENTMMNNRSTPNLTRSLIDDDDDDETQSLSTRDQETNQILSELLEEETTIRQLFELSISLRQQEEDDIPEDETIFLLRGW